MLKLGHGDASAHGRAFDCQGRGGQADGAVQGDPLQLDLPDTTLHGATDSTYQADSAYSASQVNQVCSPLVAACTPSQTVTGPDSRSYRVDTYVVWTTPAGGDRVKSVTVVVRKPGAPATFAWVVSIFGDSF